MSTQSHRFDFSGLVVRLYDTEGSWLRKVEDLRELSTFLAAEDCGPKVEQRVHNAVIEAAMAPKWEVRKAAALALAELRHLDHKRSAEVLDRLSNDPNRWVGQTAARASRRLRERNIERQEWPLTTNMADPNLQFIATRIRKIGLQSMTPARLYDLATDIGEHHYRELAADTAHEINTQLTPLEGYLLGLIEHLDKQGYDDAKLRRYAQSSLRGLKHLELLVRDLHMYSSTASGEDFEEVDLARLVEETLSIGLSHQRQTENESRIEVRASVPEGLLVEAMPSRLTRALTNLILNACQAMPNGGTLEIQAMILGSNLVEVTIRDAGRGMTSEEAEQAMKRFCTTRGNEGGTGLGLPIAQRIIELDHHGSLAIESTPGEGTRVVVSLPRRRLDDRG